MSESWDQYAEGWDSNADVILYSKKAYDALCEILSLEALTILDFGCGTGLLTEKMAPKANWILGLDSSEKMISVLKNKLLSNVDTLVAELSEETIKSNVSLHSKFDLIVASSVCAFLPDYESTLWLLKTLLKPDGVFVQWDWLKIGGDSDFGLTEEIVESTFNKTGLEVSSITKAFSFESKDGSMQVLMGVAINA
jgi:2-polyprenyl-3-methyl-5-hydroxy-6-metoxy-1,4-benzoquinol methylase